MKKDVQIGNIHLKQFFFFLIVNVEHRIALLGDDFISASKMNHMDFGGNFIIYEFDQNRYIKQFQRLAEQDRGSIHELFKTL